MEVIRTGTFLYFVDELRLVREFCRQSVSSCKLANLDASSTNPVIEASPESVRTSPTSVCSVTEYAGQKILRIAISY